MKLPLVWWRVPRPIRAAVCEVACFSWFVVLVAWITLEDFIAGTLQALASPFTGAWAAYHEWQFGRVNTGLKMRHTHGGKSIEIVGRASSGGSGQ